MVNAYGRITGKHRPTPHREEPVTQLANQLKTQSQAIGGVIAHVDGIVSHIEGAWQGHTASEFAGWWRQQHKPGLVNAQHAVDGLHQSALNNVAQQEAASGNLGGAAGAAVGVHFGPVQAHHVVPITTAPSSPAPSPSPAPAGYAAGPQHISNSSIAAAAEAELRTHPGAMDVGPDGEGWNTPGQCMVSAQRWITEAGGHTGGGGAVTDMYANSATPVDLSHLQRGDIIQYENPNNAADWSHVHTVRIDSSKTSA